MDDLVNSNTTKEEGTQQFMFLSGEFEFVKWCSNSEEILNIIPVQDRYPRGIESNSNDFIKILGLKWSSSKDSFMFNVKSLTLVIVRKRKFFQR